MRISCSFQTPGIAGATEGNATPPLFDCEMRYRIEASKDGQAWRVASAWLDRESAHKLLAVLEADMKRRDALNAQQKAAGVPEFDAERFRIAKG